jgi:hypothetical protein
MRKRYGAVLTLLTGIVWWFAMPAIAAQDVLRSLPGLAIPEAAGDRCVAPTPVIRREHMTFLKHQRDRTVYDARRGEQHSLKGCIACHVRRDDNDQTIAVNAPGQFCAECHSYVAVKMDCFECHATRPDSGKRGSGKRDPVKRDPGEHRVDTGHTRKRQPGKP